MDLMNVKRAKHNWRMNISGRKISADFINDRNNREWHCAQSRLAFLQTTFSSNSERKKS